ncbi:PilZ domain-containing protein [Boseongicola aestuarii]|uniref:PilZ domain-containing protein n=1 Tax=Boseongicola aestuarii TaxID=1470561 RepID=A0A238J132_9RHOB|nr:PilZ domain-containing protein [Boseongicola aestuarii]SMX24439.1 hypothetical protein BOA8489_02564 [Boseongicola aestuarii]
MRSPAAKRFCIPLAVMCLVGTPALACTASNRLADLAQTYKTLLQAQDFDDWQAHTARLSDALATTSAAKLGRDLDSEGARADISRIARLFADASALLNSAHGDRGYHAARTLENLVYVDGLLTATGCDEALAETARFREATDPDTTNTAQKPADTSRTAYSSLALLTLIFAAGGAYALRKKGAQEPRTIRLTRSPSSISVLVTVENGAPDLADTADISIGGVRLSWTSAPPPGTALTVDFGETERPARIIWSNAYFAGARFDTRFTDEELTRIRNRTNNP